MNSERCKVGKGKGKEKRQMSESKPVSESIRHTCLSYIGTSVGNMLIALPLPWNVSSFGWLG